LNKTTESLREWDAASAALRESKKQVKKWIGKKGAVEKIRCKASVLGGVGGNGAYRKKKPQGNNLGLFRMRGVPNGSRGTCSHVEEKKGSGEKWGQDQGE